MRRLPIPWLAVSYLTGLTLLVFCGEQLYRHYEASPSQHHPHPTAVRRRAPLHQTPRKAITNTTRRTP